MPPQAQGWEFQMQSVHLDAMGPGILWYFMGDELLLTHPGLGCAGEGAGSIPTTYILGHIPLPLWSPTPGKAGATSLPHHVIHSSSSLPPQHWQSGLKPVCPPPPPCLGGFCTPQGWEFWLPYPPLTPRSPLWGCVWGSQPARLSVPSSVRPSWALGGWDRAGSQGPPYHCPAR